MTDPASSPPWDPAGTQPPGSGTPATPGTPASPGAPGPPADFVAPGTTGYPSYAAPNYPAPNYPATSYPAPSYPDPATSYPAYPSTGQPATGYPGGYPAGGYGGYGTAPAYPYAYAPAPKTNGMAIGALVTSIVAGVMLVCYGVGGILGVVGAILGHVARRQIRERQEAGDGMALAGIIVGWVSFALGLLLVGLFIALFATFATVPDPATVPGPSEGFDALVDLAFSLPRGLVA